VTGQSPVVDRNVVQATEMTRDVLDNIPTGKLFQSVEIPSGDERQSPGVRGQTCRRNTRERIGDRGDPRQSPRDQQILFDGLDVSIASDPFNRLIRKLKSN
jgi:hypothetical protein